MSNSLTTLSSLFKEAYGETLKSLFGSIQYEYKFKSKLKTETRVYFQENFIFVAPEDLKRKHEKVHLITYID